MNLLERFRFCPICGSTRFAPATGKSNRCADCGFEYFVNPSSANVALIMNDRGELLVERRKNDPAKGTLDLPGGFADMHETVEQGVAREVMEETGLEVTSLRYLFSLPNSYHYSGVDIPTLDLFFSCQVKDTSVAQAADDAAEVMWIPVRELRPELFGLHSIRLGVTQFIRLHTEK